MKQTYHNPLTWYKDRYRVGRNGPCPCRSGRKFKRCHGDPVMLNLYEHREAKWGSFLTFLMFRLPAAIRAGARSVYDRAIYRFLGVRIQRKPIF